MKVYILQKHSIEFDEVIDVFDTLEKAQSYKDGKPEDWNSDPNSNNLWERTVVVVTGYGTSIKIHLGITEWDVK